MLGSFPPPRHRWCMDFFYPNFANDMWRIFGLVFHDDKGFFVDASARTFHLSAITKLLETKGIAIYDTALAVIRSGNTAADKGLEIVEATDIGALLHGMPLCDAVAATGQKAADVVAAHFHVKPPKAGTCVETPYCGRHIRFYRMPSSSRAYPLSIERKAEAYKRMFTECL